LICFKKGADPVPEAPTRVGSGEGNNRSKVVISLFLLSYSLLENVLFVRKQ
jgi:hypothetical protein